MSPRIYLAGPDVFFHDALDVANRKKELCAKAGLEGVFPLDNELDFAGHSPQQMGFKIGRSNFDLMRSCDAVIANLQPWHGPSADVGTVLEIGFMRGAGKPAFGYTNTPDIFERRVANFLLSDYGRDFQPGNSAFAGPGDPVFKNEEFDLIDNLMIDTAIGDHSAGIHLSFEEALEEVARYFRTLNA